MLCSALVIATDELVAARTAAGEEDRNLRIAAHKAKRAGTRYPVQYAVFNITDGEPKPVGHPVVGYTAESVANNLIRYQQHFPDHRFAILAYETRWDEQGEKMIREWVDEAVGKTASAA
jgi:hypothetical protein